ncbi:Uncharacterised protein [Moraxella catarrhalis]|nr:Uncharacterised protein [Moraxella catarrhalis]
MYDNDKKLTTIVGVLYTVLYCHMVSQWLYFMGLDWCDRIYSCDTLADRLDDCGYDC